MAFANTHSNVENIGITEEDQPVGARFPGLKDVLFNWVITFPAHPTNTGTYFEPTKVERISIAQVTEARFCRH